MPAPTPTPRKKRRKRKPAPFPDLRLPVSNLRSEIEQLKINLQVEHDRYVKTHAELKTHSNYVIAQDVEMNMLQQQCNAYEGKLKRANKHRHKAQKALDAMTDRLQTVMDLVERQANNVNTAVKDARRDRDRAQGAMFVEEQDALNARLECSKAVAKLKTSKTTQMILEKSHAKSQAIALALINTLQTDIGDLKKTRGYRICAWIKRKGRRV